MPILRGTNSALLPCGCVIGLYETYGSQTVAIVDLKSSTCTDRLHRENARVQWNAATLQAHQSQHSPERAQP